MTAHQIQDTVSIAIYRENSAPSADAGDGGNFAVGSSVTLDGSGSTGFRREHNPLFMDSDRRRYSSAHRTRAVGKGEFHGSSYGFNPDSWVPSDR